MSNHSLTAHICHIGDSTVCELTGQGYLNLYHGSMMLTGFKNTGLTVSYGGLYVMDNGVTIGRGVVMERADHLNIKGTDSI